MGREIKRVALNFSWPLGQVWRGFINPHWGKCGKCPMCGGSGIHPNLQYLERTWYDHDGQRQERWCNNITQDEVDALVKHGRLYDFTHTWNGQKWVEKNPPYHPTAEEVNEASKKCAVLHDAINQGICVKQRGIRLGLIKNGEKTDYCPHCDGTGERWENPKDKKACDDWKEEEPPQGDGYQIWETVSEGSPVSPVFAEPEKLAEWMVLNDSSVTASTTYDQWLEFIRGPGWAPSMVMSNGRMLSGVQAVASQ